MAEIIMAGALVAAAGIATAAVTAKTFLMSLRDKRGLYGWPRWVQALICLTDGIPLRAIGEFPNQQAHNDAMWASFDPAELTESGLKRRAEARARLGRD